MNVLKPSNAVYDVLKYLAQIFIPALGVLVAALGTTWDWDHVDAWVKTILAVDAFLGACLLISQVQYQKSQPAQDDDLNDLP